MIGEEEPQERKLKTESGKRKMMKNFGIRNSEFGIFIKRNMLFNFDSPFYGGIIA